MCRLHPAFCLFPLNTYKKTDSTGSVHVSLNLFNSKVTNHTHFPKHTTNFCVFPILEVRISMCVCGLQHGDCIDKNTLAECFSCQLPETSRLPPLTQWSLWVLNSLFQFYFASNLQVITSSHLIFRTNTDMSVSTGLRNQKLIPLINSASGYIYFLTIQMKQETARIVF